MTSQGGPVSTGHDDLPIADGRQDQLGLAQTSAMQLMAEQLRAEPEVRVAQLG